MFHINQLPNECLEMILRRLPLRQLFHLQLVSQRWHSCIKYLLSTEQTIVLVSNARSFVRGTFQRHTILTSGSTRIQTFLKNHLHHYFPKLASLSFHNWSQPIPENTLALSQLTHFSLNHYTEDINLVLRQLSSNLVHLQLSAISLSPEQIDNFFNHHTNRWTGSVTHLSIKRFRNNDSRLLIRHVAKVLHHISLNCPNLEYFDLEFARNLFFRQQIAELSRFRQLNTVHLYLDVIVEAAVFLFEYHQILPLPSVTVLQLNLGKGPHNTKELNLQSLAQWIHYMFPNLEQLFLATKCQYILTQIYERFDEFAQNCARFEANLIL